MFALKRSYGSVLLPYGSFDVFSVQVGKGHMIDPTVRSETSDTASRTRRQRRETENPVGKRIIEALGGQDLSWLSKRSGVSASTLSDYVARGISRADYAVQIATALNTTTDWLLSGAGARSDTSLEAASMRFTEHLRAQISAGADHPDDLVEVQEIDLAYGLGGTFSDDQVEVQTHRFPRTWIQRITSTPPSMLTFALGRGDSMQPTIQDGDMVLIDRSQRTVREWDAIWALTIGEMAMIKRIRVKGERVAILSDNDRVPPDDVFHEEINVVGRVVFIGRKL